MSQLFGLLLSASAATTLTVPAHPAVLHLTQALLIPRDTAELLKLSAPASQSQSNHKADADEEDDDDQPGPSLLIVAQPSGTKQDPIVLARLDLEQPQMTLNLQLSNCPALTLRVVEEGGNTTAAQEGWRVALSGYIASNSTTGQLANATVGQRQLGQKRKSDANPADVDMLLASATEKRQTGKAAKRQTANPLEIATMRAWGAGSDEDLVSEDSGAEAEDDSMDEAPAKKAARRSSDAAAPAAAAKPAAATKQQTTAAPSKSATVPAAAVDSASNKRQSVPNSTKPDATPTTPRPATAAATSDSNKKHAKSPAAEHKVVELGGGLKVKEIEVGSGAPVKQGQNVAIRYRGTLLNGSQFDTNMPRGQPLRFEVGAGEMIAGFDRGVVGMKVGGKRTVIVPGHLGYGKRGSPPSIPGNATLIFEIHMLKAH